MPFCVERIAKDSLLSQNSTASTIASQASLPPPPPPPAPVVARSPPLRTPAGRREKHSKKLGITPIQKHTAENDSSSCSSPSSSSENEDQPSDIENEDPLPQTLPPVSSINKRARADATSTESLSPPRESEVNTSRMLLRSSARRQQQPQQMPVSTPSFRQQRKHRRIDVETTPLNTTNNRKLPPTKSSTPQIKK